MLSRMESSYDDQARVKGLDPLIHPPARLRLMILLSSVSEAEFSLLRNRLAVSDSVLSKHISTLAEAGYARSRKGSRLGRRTTWVALTPAGTHALESHVAALRELIAGVGERSSPVPRRGLPLD